MNTSTTDKTVSETTDLLDVLDTIRKSYPSLILSDGAQDWDADNLIDALSVEDLKQEVVVDGDWNICKVDEQGYIQSIPLYRAVK